MSSPDNAAAAYEPTWKGRPLPRVGDMITVRGLARGDGAFLRRREGSGVAASVDLQDTRVGAQLVITLKDSETPYLLREGSDQCDWALRMRPERQAEPVLIAASTPAPNSGDRDSIVGLIRRLIAINLRLEAISAEEEALKAERAGLHPQIIEIMISEGMDAPPGVDGMTAYLRPVYYVERNVDPDTEEKYDTKAINDALRAAGFASMIKEGHNGNQLRMLLREFRQNGTELPEALARVVRLESRTEVAVTAAAARKRRAAPRPD